MLYQYAHGSQNFWKKLAEVRKYYELDEIDIFYSNRNISDQVTFKSESKHIHKVKNLGKAYEKYLDNLFIGIKLDK